MSLLIKPCDKLKAIFWNAPMIGSSKCTNRLARILRPLRSASMLLKKFAPKTNRRYKEQVKHIAENLHHNSKATSQLVTALSAPKGGGRWGEMTLRNVMEQAGLSSHCDFHEQVNDQTETGRQRPDAVIHLPGCLLYTSPSPRDATLSRMPSSA